MNLDKIFIFFNHKNIVKKCIIDYIKIYKFEYIIQYLGGY